MAHEDDLETSHDVKPDPLVELLVLAQQGNGPVDLLAAMFRQEFLVQPHADRNAELAAMSGWQIRMRQRCESAEAAVQRVLELADDMETWCGPIGVATSYAARVREAVAGKS